MTLLSYLLAFCVVIVVGISKAGFAAGAGALAAPLLSLVLDVRTAVGVLLPVLCASDIVAMIHYRKLLALRPLCLALPGACAGIAVGGLLLGSLNEAYLKATVGAIALLFVSWRVGKLLLGKTARPWRPSASAGLLFGAGAGFFSTMAHAAGPIMAAYLLPQGLGRRRYVGTTVFFFGIINHLKLIPYGVTGLLAAPNLRFSLALLPAVPAGVFLGVFLNKRISESAFLAAVYTLLFLAGLKLIGVPSPFDLLFTR